MRWLEPVNESGLWEIRKSYKVLIDNFKEEEQLQGPKHGWECNFKINCKLILSGLVTAEQNAIRKQSRISRDCAVDIATAYGLDDGGVRVRFPIRSRLYSMSSRPALGPTQRPIQWVPGAPSLGVKRLGRNADHSPPASSEVKKMWIYTSIPPHAFMA
jgi:hypothetical protein